MKAVMVKNTAKTAAESRKTDSQAQPEMPGVGKTKMIANRNPQCPKGILYLELAEQGQVHEGRFGLV